MNNDIEYCYSTDEECFNLDFDSVLDIINSYLEEGESTVGKVYWRGIVSRPLPSNFAPDAEDIFEIMQCRAYDRCGEWAEDFPDCSREKQKELESLINKWCDDNLDVTFYNVSNVEEMRITEDDL